MKHTTYSVTKLFKRWSYKIRNDIGSHRKPLILIVITTTLVILVAFILISNLCNCNSLKTYEAINQNKLPMIYVITPTYARHIQKAQLTRLSQTLMHVPRIHWILVEDSTDQTKLLENFIARLKIKYNFKEITLLNEKTPSEFKLKPGDPDWKYPKGVWQRNKALKWLRARPKDLEEDGVVYFADDDNTYDLELFEEMRNTKLVSVWPVGLVGGLLVERPLVSNLNSERPIVEGFNALWSPKRRYPLDMAGFAVNLRLLMGKPTVLFSYQQRIGHMESHFLNQLVSSKTDLEPKAANCTKVLVWHTKSKNPVLHQEVKLDKSLNMGIEMPEPKNFDRQHRRVSIYGNAEKAVSSVTTILG